MSLQTDRLHALHNPPSESLPPVSASAPSVSTMNAAPPPPPPPPPHGSRHNASSNANQGPGGGLPPGNYDIFVIPPHSSGSGFLYLPSLQPHRNSFLAGAFCALLGVGIWSIVMPVVRQWTSMMLSSGGPGVVLLMIGVALAGWFAGKLQGDPPGATPRPAFTPESGTTGSNGTNPTGASAGTGWGNSSYQRSGWQQQGAQSNSSSTANWEKAREEMRKREEERKKKEETERKAEKERWEKSRQREREAREKEAREKETRAREQREKDIREKLQQERLKKEREARESKEKARSAPTANGNYQKPTAQSYAASEDAYSYRPYDQPKSPSKMESNSSFVSASTGYTGTQSTAPTTAPPSHRGPYVNNDPDKVTIRGVYTLTDHFPKPVAQLVTGEGKITEGLVLRMTTEGLFIDDDVRGVGQREWDVKAWTLKLIESGELRGRHILRASIRDAENKKYVFIIDESEAWKVAVGLQRLRRGSQVRSLGVSGLSVNEMSNILKTLGW